MSFEKIRVHDDDIEDEEAEKEREMKRKENERENADNANFARKHFLLTNRLNALFFYCPFCRANCIRSLKSSLRMAAYNHLREKERTASDTSKNNERQRERQGERKVREGDDEKME